MMIRYLFCWLSAGLLLSCGAQEPGSAPTTPATCDAAANGATETRTRYEAGSVMAGATCVDEQQSRTCENGVWSAWSGGYAFDTCVVDGAAPCGAIAHGDSEDRIRYQEATVAATSSCIAETQSRECDNGVWQTWSGTYTEATCVVTGRPSCDATPHGNDETRRRYAAESVAAGSLCVSESQTRTCSDGVWGAWSGTYTFVSCAVDGANSCGIIPDGGSVNRTRFAAGSVEGGSVCQSEVQKRTCADGTWGEWSGTYIFATCVVRTGAVLTCDQRTLGLWICHQYSGPNVEKDFENACIIGTAGTSCPKEGVLGFCDLSEVGTHPSGYGQYHYKSGAIPDSAASKKLCIKLKGSWVKP